MFLYLFVIQLNTASTEFGWGYMTIHVCAKGSNIGTYMHLEGKHEVFLSSSLS